MPFHFPLEAVLRYRQSLADREQLRLESLLSTRTALLHELEQVRETCLKLKRAAQSSLAHSPTAAVELQFSMTRVGAVARHEEKVRLRLLKLQNEIAEQTARYRRERQKREVLESLRASQLEDYRTKQQRRQQAALDELHLLRRGRSPA